MTDIFIKVNDFTIDEKIKGLRKVIDKEMKLYKKHLSLYATLSDELYSLMQQRKLIFPEQYTKYGNIRKPFKSKF